jgi:hypothetical protein
MLIKKFTENKSTFDDLLLIIYQKNYKFNFENKKITRHKIAHIQFI